MSSGREACGRRRKRRKDAVSTLDELVRYCSEEKHLGALLLTGEWGCGKTYLIEHDLAETLRGTHFIVRVSLLGVDTAERLNEAIKKQYIMVCTPFLGKLKQEQERHTDIFTAINRILGSVNPVGGGIASAFGAVDPLDYIPIEPVVEDLHDKRVKKRVVLVFDDLNRSRLDWSKFVGTINEYCENKGITTIVIGDMDTFKEAADVDIRLYKTVKEKTIARTVRYLPDYRAIIHSILTETVWPSQEYGDFLLENEQSIYDVFVRDPADPKGRLRKYHTIRSLRCSLQEFYRLYEILTERESPEILPYLYSFIVYLIVSRNGIERDGKPSIDSTEEEIKQLYPDYRPDLLTDDIRQWIDEGIWEKESILRHISGQRNTAAET